MFLNQRPDLLDAMAASGQVLVPTLSGYYWMAGLGDAVGARPRRRGLPEMAAAARRAGRSQPGAGHGLDARPRVHAGVKIALGSDMASLWTGLEIQRMSSTG